MNPLTGDPLVAGPETTAAAFDPEHPGTVYRAVHAAQGYFVTKSVDGTLSNVLQLDRPLYGLTVGAGGVLHGSQTPNLPQAYLVMTDTLGNLRYGTYLGGAFTQVNAVAALGGKIFVAGKTLGGRYHRLGVAAS